MAGMAWLAPTPPSSPRCCGPAIAQLGHRPPHSTARASRPRAPARPWSGPWMPATAQTTRLFRVRDHGRGFVVGGLVGASGFPLQQPKVSVGDRHGRGRKHLMSSAARSTPATRPAPSPAEPLAHQVLAGLAQHRIATTSQLRRMLRPDGTRQLMSRVLNRLRSDGFVDCTVLPDANRTRTNAWYLTPDGARLTRDLPVLRGRPPYPITSDTAASLKTPHTLAVVRAHLAFAEDARRLGHEHGPWDWTLEVSHSIGEGERIVADAVMYYTVVESERRRKLRAFVEVDRSTMSSERLAVKLIEY